ncbi:MAG: hypothetical protein N2689_05185 [Verrucomicrobiae bacterium]|nr:hypothetical protein [Verrucomicrobiae bacterium]
MKRTVALCLLAVCLPALFLAAHPACAASRALGNGFSDHGAAAPISHHRGTVATVDGEGRNIVLSWLNDHRGGYELLLIDVEAARAEEHPMPFPPGDHPFSSILSSANKFYTHFNRHFVEFDSAKRAFTFCQKTKPQMAMSMTEDDNGVIWSATYPNSGLVSFNPKTREFKDHGYLNKENWAQYPRAVAVDDAGWVYLGIGSTRGQIVAFDPQTGKATPLIPEEQRVHGYTPVYRDMDGKVYGAAVPGKSDNWLMLYKGKATPVGKHHKQRPKPCITGSQGLFHAVFPDGRRIKTYDLVNRKFAVEDPKTRQAKAFSFDYRSEGAYIVGAATAPDGTICGGTAFPMRFFSYDPRKDECINREAYGQWNTVARQGDRFFIGGYGHGFLLEWDPARPWAGTVKGKTGCNPLYLTECHPTINRPHDLLAHPDGKTLVMAGTPGYGLTGGGLLFWDRQTRTSTVLTHEQIIPQHSTMSLAPLPNGELLGGTTTSAGTGGERKAKEAALYIMDMATKQVEWQQAVFPGAQGYTDLCAASGGLVYGFAEPHRFFVFDPAARKVIHEQLTGKEFGPTVSQQGPRVFVRGPKEEIYVLFTKGIARVEPRTFQIKLIAPSPVRLATGGDYLDGRIYFANGSHLYSYKLPD